MSRVVTPEAAEIMTVMLEETLFPENWETSGLWLTHAQLLAQYIADHRGRMSLDDAATLAGLGGLLLEMAKRERAAAGIVGRFFDRDGGAK